MTNPAGVVTGLFTNAAFGVPLLLLGLAALAWFLLDRGRLPPRLEPSRPNRDWVRGPTAAVYEALESDRLSPAIDYASYRVEVALGRRFGVSLTPSPPSYWKRLRLPTTARALLDSLTTLDRAYQLARLAETVDPSDTIGQWRRPAWEARSRALFRDVLNDLAPILPPLEVAA